MKILHVAAIAAQEPTGPAHSVPLQMLAESRQGHEVALLQTWRGDPPKLPAVAVHIPWRVPGFSIGTGTFPAQRLLERAKFWPDIVHFHSVYLPLHAVIADAFRRLGVPTVNSPRGGLMPAALATRSLKKRIGNLLFFDRFCRGLALHRALNESERDACLARYTDIPVCVVPNPIDLDALTVLPPPQPGPETLVIGFLGRIETHMKGLDLLLHGFRGAVEAGLPAGVRLRLAGPDHRGGTAEVQRLIRNLQLGDRVEISGARMGSEKVKYLKEIDVFIHPSRHEGQPMGVLEAIAVGRPVVVTPETHLGSFVAKHAAGWVVEGSADAIARLLCEIAAQPDAVVERGRAGREAVRSEFSLDAVGSLLTIAYKDILDRAGRRSV